VSQDAPALARRAYELFNLRDVGRGFILAHARGSGHSETGTPLLDPFWQPTEWAGGRCVWWRNVSTESEGLEAVAERQAGG
jgi:hypothetical protein